jgi:hypothetical protein
MRFSVPKVQTVRSTAEQRLTAEHAQKIINIAHEKGLDSIALAQAFQFDCITLRQKDVIGEWVPVTEPGPADLSNLHDGTSKWTRGLRWEEIDSNLVLRHTPIHGVKEIVIDLRNNAPTVMAEFKRIGDLPKSGPIIVYERSRLPYRTFQFRQTWRQLADAAGIPKNVKNKDSRAGAGEELKKMRPAETKSAGLH